jgi:hypothetical protein
MCIEAGAAAPQPVKLSACCPAHAIYSTHILYKKKGEGALSAGLVQGRLMEWSCADSALPVKDGAFCLRGPLPSAASSLALRMHHKGLLAMRRSILRL